MGEINKMWFPTKKLKSYDFSGFNKLRRRNHTWMISYPFFSSYQDLSWWRWFQMSLWFSG
jgi:hypothetical protein